MQSNKNAFIRCTQTKVLPYRIPTIAPPAHHVARLVGEAAESLPFDHNRFPLVTPVIATTLLNIITECESAVAAIVGSSA
eukprot:1377085-Rhodomonas_salina.1